ncbi:mevalonate kinase family protein [Curtobacterium sp. 24E2]|nr:hypothetical protein JN350_18015 [Curtobacterium sp. 24E2]
MTSSDLDSTTTPGSGTASSHGKTILIGEHAVVYGAPALVLPVLDARVVATVTPVSGGAPGHTLESTVHTGPLDLAPAAVMPTVTAVTATLRHFGVTDRHFHVRVDSEVPTARGMGSSAAVAAAVTAAVADALGETLDADTHHDLIQECERVAHGRPSGLDARGVVAAVPVWFEGAASSPSRSGPASPSSSPTPVSPATPGRRSRPCGNGTTRTRSSSTRSSTGSARSHAGRGGHSRLATHRGSVPRWTPRTTCSVHSTCRVPTWTGSSTPHVLRTPSARS